MSENPGFPEWAGRGIFNQEVGYLPGNFVTADAKLADLEKSGNVKEWMGNVASLIFMLLEELKYVLNNLGTENFNDEELKILSAVLTEPVTIRIQNAEGNIADLVLAADEISTQVRNVEGDLSKVRQTAAGLTSTVTSHTGKISQIEQTVNGLSVSVNGGTTYIGASILIDQSEYQATEKPVIEVTDQNGYISAVVAKIAMSYANGKHYMNIGAANENDSGRDVCLKLTSGGDTSYESINGSLDLAAKGYIHLRSTGGQPVGIAAPSGTWYTFRDDGIYYGNRRIVDNNQGV